MVNKIKRCNSIKELKNLRKTILEDEENYQTHKWYFNKRLKEIQKYHAIRG